MSQSNPPQDPGRRRFLTAAGISAAAAGSLPAIPAAAQSAAEAPAEAPPVSVEVRLTINGQERRLPVDGRASLLDVLRNEAGLTGTKKGCDHGQCGACTVHLDGRRVLSCLTLAVQASNHEVTTIEGLAPAEGGLHPMQQAFIDQDAFQCGYCTPGQIMSAVALVAEGKASNPDTIREFMSGNLCRCAAYPNIVAAIEQAAKQMPQG